MIPYPVKSAYLGLACLLMAFSKISLAGTYQLPIPDVYDETQQAYETYTLEVGGYDVTQLSSWEGTNISLTLTAGIESGEHPVTLTLYYSNGEIESFSLETIVVEAKSNLTHYQYNGSLGVTYRADEKDPLLFEGIDHTQTNGGIDASIKHVRGNWEASASAQTLYDTQDANNPTGDEWAMPNYQVAVKYSGELASAQASLGETQVIRSNLVFDQYQRRGMALEVGFTPVNAQAQVFSVLSDPSTHLDENLAGAQNSDERTWGALVETGLIPQHPDVLRVGAGIVSGEGTSAGEGFAIIDEETRYGGTSYTFTLDSFWLERSLWLRGEYAESEFDTDGLDFGEGDKSAHAWQMLAQISSEGSLSAGPFDLWSVTLSRQLVEPDFYSIANLYLPGDVEISRGIGQLQWQGLMLDGEIAQEVTNVDDQLDRATRTTDLWRANASWTPTLDTESFVSTLLGTPTLMAGISENRVNQTDGDAERTGIDIDQVTREYSAGLTLAYNYWDWGVQHVLTRVDDQSQEVYQEGFLMWEPPSDNNNRLTSLSINAYPFDRLTLGGSLQWNHLEETQAENDYKTFSGNAYVQAGLIPETLDLSVNYSWSKDRYEYAEIFYDDEERVMQTSGFDLTWTPYQPKNHIPGLQGFVNGQYSHADDRTFALIEETWQLYVGVRLTWAGSNQE